MMSLFELRKKSLATLLAVVLAAMLAGCAGTSSGDSAGSDDCGCAENDFDCKERCLRENTP